MSDTTALRSTKVVRLTEASAPAAPREPRPPGVVGYAGPLLGGAFGLSGLVSGLYGQTQYLVAGLVVLALLVAITVACGPPSGGPGRLAVASAAGLVAWLALSMTWAESVERAWVEVDRWVLYAALVAAVVVAVGSVRAATQTMSAIAAAIGLVAAITAVKALGGGAGMFFDYRLQWPV